VVLVCERRKGIVGMMCRVFRTEQNTTQPLYQFFLADRRVPVQISGNVGEQIRQRLSVGASCRIGKCLGALQG
jgi:hypothetical protein